MDSLIRNYFIKNIRRENFGQIENADIESHGSICDNPDGDIVSIFANIKDGKISEIKMECGPCDPTAIVATNIAVDILKDRNIEEILSDKNALIADFEKILGGKSEDGIGHFLKIIDQLKGLISEYNITQS
ncbi:MAG: hypothetical protein GWP03_04495 [Proteobacteria bacterium]|nr:hypothetical protein [Pseudomonadota bacterium]